MQGSIETQGLIVVLSTLFILLFILFWFLFLGFRREVVHGNRCPYSDAIMTFGSDLARSLQLYVNDFLKEYPEEDNPQIDFSEAAICPVTGRIFTKCVQKKKKIILDWTFIQKRFKGTFVSWGSISPEEQGELRLIHGDIEGFQTEQTSALVRPDRVEREYALLSPGPLYVDRVTKVLLGWKRVPGTDFEVLIVQRPLFQSIEETL